MLFKNPLKFQFHNAANRAGRFNVDIDYRHEDLRYHGPVVIVKEGELQSLLGKFRTYGVPVHHMTHTPATWAIIPLTETVQESLAFEVARRAERNAREQSRKAAENNERDILSRLNRAAGSDKPAERGDNRSARGRLSHVRVLSDIE